MPARLEEADKGEGGAGGYQKGEEEGLLAGWRRGGSLAGCMAFMVVVEEGEEDRERRGAIMADEARAQAQLQREEEGREFTHMLPLQTTRECLVFPPS